MEIEEVTVTLTKWKLTTLNDVVALLDWSRDKDGLAIAVSARSSGEVVVQAEGQFVSTVYATLGDTLVWDGTRFSIEGQTPSEPAP